MFDSFGEKIFDSLVRKYLRWMPLRPCGKGTFGGFVSKNDMSLAKCIEWTIHMLHILKPRPILEFPDNKPQHKWRMEFNVESLDP
jgi:hypothetical protein